MHPSEMNGQKLMAYAKKTASDLGIETKKKTMHALILEIQATEGNTACFRLLSTCPEKLCAWRKACGVK